MATLLLLMSYKGWNSPDQAVVPSYHYGTHSSLPTDRAHNLEIHLGDVIPPRKMILHYSSLNGYDGHGLKRSCRQKRLSEPDSDSL